MGLFSKPTEDKVLSDFNALTLEQQEIVKQKLFGAKEEPPKEEQPKEEPKEEEPTPLVESAQPTETAKVEDGEAKKTESFEELFKRLQEENDKKFAELKKSFSEQLETLKPKEPEKKPFGLSEGSKEYKATYKKEETSDDMLKSIFGK